MSRIELWWRIVSGEEEDFDLYEYGRPERWSAPVWIRKNPEETESFLRARHCHFDERLKWVLHDAEGDARIELCLASINPGSAAAMAPGAANAEPLRFSNGNSTLPAQPVKTDSGTVTGALLSSYRSEIKRAILTQLALHPKATDGEICRGLDADGSVELPSSWKSKVSDRSFFDAYSDAIRRHKVEVTISKVRKDLRKQGLLD